jgi:hypothetical protein
MPANATEAPQTFSGPDSTVKIEELAKQLFRGGGGAGDLARLVRERALRAALRQVKEAQARANEAA